MTFVGFSTFAEVAPSSFLSVLDLSHTPLMHGKAKVFLATCAIQAAFKVELKVKPVPQTTIYKHKTCTAGLRISLQTSHLPGLHNEATHSTL